MEISQLMRQYFVVLFALCFVFCGSSCNSGNQLKQLEWILGNWQYVTPEGTFVEQWQKNEEGFNGNGWYIIKKDTVFHETLQVRVKNGGIYYIAQVQGQNAGKPVEFMLTGMAQQLVFENPSHDFPKKITYAFHDDDHMTAIVEGIEKGKSRMEEIKLTRVR